MSYTILRMEDYTKEFNVGDMVYYYKDYAISKGRVVSIKSNGDVRIKVGKNETCTVNKANARRCLPGTARELAEAMGLRDKKNPMEEKLIPISTVKTAIAHARKKFTTGENSRAVYDCLRYIEKRITEPVDSGSDYVVRVKKKDDTIGEAMTGSTRWDYASLGKDGVPCWSSQNDTISFETAEGAKQFANENMSFLCDNTHDFTTLQVVQRNYNAVN